MKAPKGLTHQGLIRVVFSVEPLRSLSNDPHNRKIRRGFESLRNRLIPIVSLSEEAGYRLYTSPDAIENMVMEWESRITYL